MPGLTRSTGRTKEGEITGITCSTWDGAGRGQKNQKKTGVNTAAVAASPELGVSPPGGGIDTYVQIVQLEPAELPIGQFG